MHYFIIQIFIFTEKNEDADATLLEKIRKTTERIASMQTRSHKIKIS
jgi:hypothetical protein